MSDMSATRKAALWVGVVFLLGAALGGMMGYGFAHRSVSAGSTPLPEPVRRAQRVEQLTQLLNLTKEQGRQLDAILMQKHAESKALHDQMDAQLEQVHKKGRDQVRAVLTPEQRPKFEEFLKNIDEQRKRSGSK
jgi:Spy/CpxP family protein refolding chaperone